MEQKHNVKYKRSGSRPAEAITPVCSGGWRGETIGPGHKDWDDQFETVWSQGRNHLKDVKTGK